MNDALSHISNSLISDRTLYSAVKRDEKATILKNSSLPFCSKTI